MACAGTTDAGLLGCPSSSTLGEKILLYVSCRIVAYLILPCKI